MYKAKNYKIKATQIKSKVQDVEQQLDTNQSTHAIMYQVKNNKARQVIKVVK